MSFARRTDATHRVVVKTLRKLGWLIIDTSRTPGFVDVIAFKPYRGIRLVEIKTGNAGMTKSQSKLLTEGWPIAFLNSEDDAILWDRQLTEFVSRSAK